MKGTLKVRISYNCKIDEVVALAMGSRGDFGGFGGRACIVYVKTENKNHLSSVKKF